MSEVKHVEGKLIVRGLEILEESGDVVALCLDKTTGCERDEANAAELSRRWNCHQELLGALKAIAAMTDADNEEGYRADDSEGCLDTVHSKARAAITKAKLSN